MPVGLIYCWQSICILLLLVCTFVFLNLVFLMIAIEFSMSKVDYTKMTAVRIVSVRIFAHGA